MIETVLVIVVPAVVGFAVLRLAQTTPAIGRHPIRTAVALFAALVVLVSLLTPGGDMLTPAVGGVVGAIVCSVVLVELRRRGMNRTA